MRHIHIKMAHHGTTNCLEATEQDEAVFGVDINGACIGFPFVFISAGDANLYVVGAPALAALQEAIQQALNDEARMHAAT